MASRKSSSRKSKSYPGCYEVIVEGYRYLVYESEGLWFAKDFYFGSKVDAAPKKAELIRSLEAR